PVILSRDHWRAWLGEELVSPEKVKTLLKPFAAERMECWPVGKSVGNANNDEPQMVLPL
ncbi:MAG: SOS response-associated peptidase family protein, partial [Alphaproteobacteria bacterium]|nr:SOS response-associated peptidase family protein [Alphaproteobacteria bacterium]